MADAQLQVVIKARNQAKAEFDSLNKQVGQMQGAKGFDGLKGKIAGVDGAFQKLTGVSLLAGGAIGLAGMALKKMADYSKVTIDAASDLEETETKVGVVFGDQAASMLAWGESAAESMGMSSNAALAAAGTYGNLFRAMGMGVETSASMSKNLVKLAADLASFNNMDPTEVLDKLRAGLSGETEPLKTLGVNLNQAAIQAKALEDGLWNGVGAMDASAKAQATYALILEQTTLAQGDFARTSEGLANQQRILAGNSENLAAAIGENLLPLKTAWVSMLNDVTEGLYNLIEAQNRERRILEGEGDMIEAQSGRFEALMEYYSSIGMYGEEAYTSTMNALRASDAYTQSLNAQAKAYYAAHPEEVTAEIAAYLGIAQTGPGIIGPLTTSITGLGNAASTVSQYFNDMTEAMLFNKLAANMTESAALALGVQMGLVDPMTYSLSLKIEDLTNKYDANKDGILTNTEMTKDYYDEVKKMQDLVGSLRDKTITITVVTNSYGGEGGGIGGAELLAGVDLNGNGIIGKARGGAVASSTPYLVGEVGPELFVPNTSGQIIPNNKLSGGGGGSAGGVTNIYFTYAPALSLSDRAEFEGRVIPMMKRLISKAG